MKIVASMVAVAFCACATAPVVSNTTVEDASVVCQVTPVTHATSAVPPNEDLGVGVWMCTSLAAQKAGKCAESEDGYRRCQDTLKQTNGWDWRPLVTGIVTGATVGVALAAGAYELRDWLQKK